VVGLTTGQIRELKERFGSLHDAAVAALQDSPFAEELAATGARLTTALRSGRVTFFPPSEQYEELFWKLVWLTHERGAKRERGAPELGIPDKELLWIIERRLENGDRASREWLAMETKRRTDLEYVPRPRLSPLVDWIDAHPEAARRALSLRTIPSEFRAGKLGRVPPSA
jgi:hypothetical protein